MKKSIKNKCARQKNFQMKRGRNEHIKNCQVTKGCLIQCEQNGKWAFLEETPENLKMEQKQCKEAESKQNPKKLTRVCITSPEIKQQIRNANVIIDILKSTLEESNARDQHPLGILAILGTGSFGTVLSICYNKYQYAVKMETNVDETVHFEHEFKMQTLFYNLGLAPKPLHFIPESFKYPSMIVMNELDGLLINWLKESTRTIDELDYIMREIIRILVTLTQNNVMHRDLHFGNIGYILNPNSRTGFDLFLIDFGLSQTGSNLEIELVSLILSTYRHIHESANFEYLKNALMELYVKSIEEDMDANQRVGELLQEPIEFWELKKSQLFQGTNPIECDKITFNGVACTGKLINFKIGDECLLFCKQHVTKVLHEFIFFMLNNNIWIDDTPLRKPIVFFFDSNGEQTTIEQRNKYSLYINGVQTQEDLSSVLVDIKNVKVVFQLERNMQNYMELYTMINNTKIMIDYDVPIIGNQIIVSVQL
jgi:tRNA A-37 threonylcarbamoyl transferase component Bud32